MVALLLALVAAMTPFVAEHNLAYAQVNADTDSTLSNLTLSAGKLSPALDLDTPGTTYAASVPHGTNSVTVTATPNILGAQVSIRYGGTLATTSAGTGTAIGSAGTAATGGSVPLSVGPTVIGIEVKARDYLADDDTSTTGVDESTLVSVYVVTVTRLSAGLSDKADLTGLTLTGLPSGGTNVTETPSLSPSFKTTHRTYTALVSNATTSVTVTPTRVSGATLVIMPGSLTDTGDVTLSEGRNAITIKVTAENLVNTKTYTLTVTRAAASASDDGSLKDLSLSGITLSPAFKSSTLTYTANVPHGTTQTTVTPVVNHPWREGACDKSGRLQRPCCRSSSIARCRR